MADLIEKLSKLGRGFLQPDNRTAFTVGAYVECAGKAFDLAIEDRVHLMSLMFTTGEDIDESTTLSRKFIVCKRKCDHATGIFSPLPTGREDSGDIRGGQQDNDGAGDAAAH